MIFKGDKVGHTSGKGVFEIIGSDDTHYFYFAKDKQGIVYRFRRDKIIPLKAKTRE